MHRFFTDIQKVSVVDHLRIWTKQKVHLVFCVFWWPRQGGLVTLLMICAHFLEGWIQLNEVNKRNVGHMTRESLEIIDSLKLMFLG